MKPSADITLNPMPALRLEKIGKRYVGTTALADVDLDLWHGEIHAVLGENGAGKSTLIKVVTGNTQRSAGDMLANGALVDVRTPRDAARLGITYVPQDILLVPELPVGRNILLGLEERAVLNVSALSLRERQQVTEALQLVGAGFAPDTPTKELAVPQLRLAQLARALVQPGEILVLDEPTAVLAEPDADRLLDKLVGLRDIGKAIVYITHRLSEVLKIADRATVLRDGKRVGCLTRGEFDRATFVSLMAKEVAATGPRPVLRQRGSQKAQPVLEASNISVAGRFENVTLTVSAGQIVGIAGVQGSGHGHVLRAIAGLDEREEGTVRLFNHVVQPGKVRDTFRMGLRLVPADRRGAGIFADLRNRENIVVSPDAPRSARRLGFRAIKREHALAERDIRKMDVRPPEAEKTAGMLSGGNQQKIVLARALSENAKILLIEEPTQGIDVRSRTEIHALLRAIALEKDVAVLIASSEFDELIGLADTIHVMRLGQLAATLGGENATYKEILNHALS